MPTTTKDAIALLKADHAKVRALLSQLEKTTEKGVARREKLVEQIGTELEVHAAIEEELFYPAYRDAVSRKDDRELYYEAVEEHHVVKLVLPELRECEPSTPEFGAKAMVLKELVEHHAKEEEEEMFPKARKALEREELVELGERMQARRKQLLGGGMRGVRGGNGRAREAGRVARPSRLSPVAGPARRRAAQDGEEE